MKSETIRFERVTARRSKSGKCPVCGRRVTRSRTFEQTINPFNTGPDGFPKDRAQIWRELGECAEAWEPDFTHDACTDMNALEHEGVTA